MTGVPSLESSKHLRYVIAVIAVMAPAKRALCPRSPESLVPRQLSDQEEYMSSSIVAILKALRSVAPSVEDERHGNNEFLRSLRTPAEALREVRVPIVVYDGPDAKNTWTLCACVQGCRSQGI